jgi:hypothetical protein
MDTRSLHLKRQGHYWVMGKEGALRSTRVYPTRELGISCGRLFARRHNLELVIHEDDGTVEHIAPF